MTDKDEILTAPEIAKLLKVCTKTVYTWSHRADFPAIKIGNTVRIPYSLLMDWVNAQATNKEGVSCLFVHHNRKMKDDDDPFNMISGTNGIMGAADTIWTITKAKREDEEATLHITGRDVEQSDTVIRFDKTIWRWEPVGEAAQLAEERARAEYNQSPIVQTIKKLLEQSPERRWDGTAKDLMEAGKYIARTYLAVDNQRLGYDIRNLEKPLFDYDGIVYSFSKTSGNGGKKYHFYYQDLRKFEEPPEQENIPWSDT